MTLIAAAPSSPSICDHSATIRAQIEADVRRLVQQLCEYTEGEWEPSDGVGEIVPEYVNLGSLVVMHRGRDLYRDGDLIEGLPVRIGACPNRTIEVCADRVTMVRGGWQEDENWVVSDRREQNVCVRTTW